jgi:glycosyltransferase involved in cell wall biosynthesis
MLSVIIPSRSPQYLQKTIDDVIAKAEGETEVIIVLDGYWPVPIIQDHPKVKIIHHGVVHNSKGMRESINQGVALSIGEYIMKIDEHCMLDKGYDRKLIADCEDNWVVIPRRYRLDPDNWKLIKDGRPPIDYMFIAYPYERPYDKTCGLHGAEWKARHYERKDILIDDTMSWQGSCYFMKRKHWDNIGSMDSDKYGPFTQEPQEIGNKTWLSGGRVVVNKKTWYAHWHKGKRGKGYGFSNQQYIDHRKGTEQGRLFCIDYWINNKWSDRKHDFEWLLKKFWPVPTWPDNWKEQILIDQKFDYSRRNEKQIRIN